MIYVEDISDKYPNGFIEFVAIVNDTILNSYRKHFGESTNFPKVGKKAVPKDWNKK